MNQANQDFNESLRQIARDLEGLCKDQVHLDVFREICKDNPDMKALAEKHGKSYSGIYNFFKKDKFTKYFKNNPHISSLFAANSSNGIWMSEKEMGVLFGVGLDYVAGFFKHKADEIVNPIGNGNFIHFDHKLNLFFFEEDVLERIEALVQYLANDVPGFFQYSEISSVFEQRVHDICVQVPVGFDYEKYLVLHGYSKSGHFYKKNNLPLQKIYIYLFKHTFSGRALRISNGSSDVQDIIKAAKQLFDVDIMNDPKNILSALGKCENLLLVDKATYMYCVPGNLLDIHLRDRIRQSIETHLKSLETIDAQQIYDEFENELQSKGITSKYYLYSLVNHYFVDIDGNPLYKNHGNQIHFKYYKQPRRTKNDRMRDFLKKQPNCEASTPELLKQFQIPTDELVNFVSTQPDVIFWNSSVVKLFESIGLTPAEEHELLRLMNDEFQSKKYLLLTNFMETIKGDEQLKSIIENRGVDDHKRLARVLISLYKLRFYRNASLKSNLIFIFFDEEGKKIDELVDRVILATLGQSPDLLELHNLLKKWGYSESGANKVVERWRNLNIEIKIGDIMRFGQYKEKPIIWQVIHVDTDGDPMLFSVEILDWKIYDPITPYEGYLMPYHNGSNDWEDSSLRDWLNSDRLGVDAEPEVELNDEDDLEFYDYSKEPGFLSEGNFKATERASIKPFKQRVILPVHFSEHAEGGNAPHIFEKDPEKMLTNWDDAFFYTIEECVSLLSVQQYKQYVYDQRQILGELLFQSRGEYWLSTVETSSILDARIVTEKGEVDSYLVEMDSGVRPALYLNLKLCDGLSGAGTLEDPYVVERN